MKNFIALFALVFALSIGNTGMFALQSATRAKQASENTVSPQYIIVDDYAGVSLPGRLWYYTRIGSDRGEMGGGLYTVNIGGGSASVTVQNGWAGFWCCVKHNAITNDVLNPTQLLGPYVKNQYQPRIIGIEMDIINGSGQFKIELKDINNNFIAWHSYQLTGGQTTLSYSIAPTTDISRLNWLVDGAGHATVDEVRFVIESPGFTIPEAMFLFSYNHLSQCYDEATGLVRDRARWPVEDNASVQTIGTFALATAIAWELGYVEESVARNIIIKTKNTILNLPLYHGLLPHFLENGVIHPNSEWSSVDTVITLVSEILACQAMGEETSTLEAMLQNIDWNDLTDNGTRSISHGYYYSGNKIDTRWDTFGSESFLVAVAYSAATGNNNVILEGFDYPPTWDGSGFNDELSALFFPMNTTDQWGNDWAVYRQDAFASQLIYIANLTGIHQDYKDYELFGLSACEVPEPWTVPEDDIYGAWGVGGHIVEANDGISLVGYPIIAPHYAAMIAAEHPDEFENVFRYLTEVKGIFTPLNNVESFGIDNTGNLHWNSLKGSWNLSLQVLGISRALSNGNYLAYQALSQNDFLYQGFGSMVQQAVTITSPNGGEEWQKGATHTITWVSKGLSGEVNIDLYKGGLFDSNLGTAAVTEESFSWYIPPDFTIGNDYQVRICQGSTGDYSDSDFSIILPPLDSSHTDLNGDGNVDVLWRYYGTGGYNAVWLRGTASGAAPGMGISSKKNNVGVVDMKNVGELGKVADKVDMNISIQELRKRGIKDGFEEYHIAKVDHSKPLIDPFDLYMKKSKRGEAVSRIMASTVSDPRDDPEAVELPAAVNLDWKLCGTGDFNGDYKVDLVWRNLIDGRNLVWYMDGVTFTGNEYLPSAVDLDWTLCGTGDFNSDGIVDLVWRNISDGRNLVWYLDGVTLTGTEYLPTAVNLDWTLCGTGDFNSDGKVDLVWRNLSDGRNLVWYLDGVTLTGVEFLPSAVNMDWTLCGSGDFDNDGKVDLLWRNLINGSNLIWYLDGVTLTGTESLTTVTNTTWRIEN